MASGSGNGPLRMMPAIEGEGAGGISQQQRQQHLGAVSRHDDDRVVCEPGKDVDHRHARDDDAEHLAGEQIGIPLDQTSIDGGQDAADRWSHERTVLRDRPHRRRLLLHAPNRIDGRLQGVRVGAVDDHGEQLGALGTQFGERERRDLPHRRRCASGGGAQLLRPRLLIAAAEDEQHRCAEVRGDAGVVPELGGTGDIGVVAADDDDGIALRLDCFEAPDDRPERPLRVVADLVVGDADAVVVVEVHAVVGEHELQHVVALCRRPRDGPEDAHPRSRAHERVKRAQGDRGLARMAFGRGDVDARATVSAYDVSAQVGQGPDSASTTVAASASKRS